MIETIFAHNLYARLAARAVAGVALGAAAGIGASRAGMLTRKGAVAAAICGTLCVVAGWGWAALLILYFLAASLLPLAVPASRGSGTERIVEKGGARDATQVLANGGLYSLLAPLWLFLHSPALVAGALGALAAASADTWATEIGVGFGGNPRSITNRTTVPVGQSGGVTMAGFLGSLGGAAFIGGVALAVGFSRGVVLALIVAGVGGSLADSLLGATLQERRWCDACVEPTERVVHVCGCVTRRVGGINRLDNDVVNLISTVTGFLLGVLAYMVVSIA